MVDDHFFAAVSQMRKGVPQSTLELLQLFELCQQFVWENKRMRCDLCEFDEIALQFKVVDSDPFWLLIGNGGLYAEVGEIDSGWNDIRLDIVLEGTLSDLVKLFFYCYDSDFIGERGDSGKRLRVLNFNDLHFDWENIERVQDMFYNLVASLGFPVDPWFDLLEELDLSINFICQKFPETS